MSRHARRHHEQCLNCGTSLTGPWCTQCGQMDPHPDFQLGELVHDVAHKFTHWDGKVLATLRELVTKPGQLTVNFLGGRRARWLPPFRLYPIASIAYFLAVPAVQLITHRSARIATITLSDTLFAPTDSGAKSHRQLKPEGAGRSRARFFGVRRRGLRTARCSWCQFRRWVSSC